MSWRENPARHTLRVCILFAVFILVFGALSITLNTGIYRAGKEEGTSYIKVAEWENKSFYARSPGHDIQRGGSDAYVFENDTVYYYKDNTEGEWYSARGSEINKYFHPDWYFVDNITVLNVSFHTFNATGGTLKNNTNYYFAYMGRWYFLDGRTLRGYTDIVPVGTAFGIDFHVRRADYYDGRTLFADNVDYYFCHNATWYIITGAELNSFIENISGTRGEDDVWQQVSDGLASMGQSIQEGLTSVSKSVSDGWNAVVNAVNAIPDAIENTLEDMKNSLVQSLWNAFTGPYKWLFGSFKYYFLWPDSLIHFGPAVTTFNMVLALIDVIAAVVIALIGLQFMLTHDPEKVARLKLTLPRFVMVLIFMNASLLVSDMLLQVNNALVDYFLPQDLIDQAGEIVASNTSGLYLFVWVLLSVICLLAAITLAVRAMLVYFLSVILPIIGVMWVFDRTRAWSEGLVALWLGSIFLTTFDAIAMRLSLEVMMAAQYPGSPLILVGMIALPTLIFIMPYIIIKSGSAVYSHGTRGVTMGTGLAFAALAIRALAYKLTFGTLKGARIAKSAAGRGIGALQKVERPPMAVGGGVGKAIGVGGRGGFGGSEWVTQSRARNRTVLGLSATK